MENLTDEKLIELLKNGNQDAFSQLSLRYFPIIRVKASKYKAVTVDFEDFIQEGLLALLFATKHYNKNSGATFSTYAGVCISNRFASIVRQTNRKKDIPSDLMLSYEQDDFNTDDATSTPEQKLIDKENYINVLKKIKQALSPMEYNVLKLYLAGKSYEEIAESMSLPYKTVDNALQRIRKKLKPG